MPGKQCSNKVWNVLFYGVVILVLIATVFFIRNMTNDNQVSGNNEISQQAEKNPAISEVQEDKTTEASVPKSEAVNEVQEIKPEASVTAKTENAGVGGLANASQNQPSKTEPLPAKTEAPKTVASKPNQSVPLKTEPKVQATEKPAEDPGVAIKITKAEVTSKVAFYPYKADGIYMEVIAVKASDGTIRTALNTCQVCFDSGRGYYQQVGEYLVCQNCRNKFHIDHVEKVKGGCNPVPILEENKKDTGTLITISKDYLSSQSEFFSNWKR